MQRAPSLLRTSSAFRAISVHIYSPRLPAVRRAMATRSYKDAIEHLNSVQSNAASIEALRASGGRIAFAISEMVEYLNRIGYSASDLNRLNVIHVTGTKGKGSTCAFTNSILCHSRPDWKIGLYTSPHLVAVRERIRINGMPLSEEDFAKFFFEVWDRLENNTTRADAETSVRPMYFRLMTLVAYHAFLTLKVDATILEVGVGGRHDSTNIVPKPLVTGVSALGIDHVTTLGRTLKEIAWHKGGIYKEGVPALTVNQPDEGAEVLKQLATELKASEFVVVPPTPGLSNIKLGLAGLHQYQNANLAVHLVQTFFREKESVKPQATLPEVFADALKVTKWPGRCHTVQDPDHASITWFLDGAHTHESLDCCIQWFVSPEVALRPTEVVPRNTRVLIFNCTHGRSGGKFLDSVFGNLTMQLELHGQEDNPAAFFDHVIFCTNVTYQDGAYKGDLVAVSTPEAELTHLTTQRELAAAWSSLMPTFPSDRIYVLPTIEHAVNIVRALDSPQVDVLVTGSLLLVGGMIEAAGLSEVAL
ncbi:Mur ligase [Amylocystis lapponica]|nr:Mur ligase [Amylocystis lapponica]